MSISSLYPSISPSLILDFANSKVLDSRVTFTRTTTATYYDGVTTAKAEENLVTYSQDFSNAAWTKDGTSLTSGVTDPAGGTTAFKLTATGGNRRIYQSVTQVSGLQYVYSIYMRRVTGTGTISMWNAVQGVVDVTAQVSSTWSRVSVPVQTASGNSALLVVFGTTSDEIEIWGAQAEQRSSVTAYTATTTQAITNYIPVLQTASAGQARFDHNPTTGESLGLLIEEARTNSVTYSSQFSNVAWTKSACSITSTANVAPDGTLTAQQLVEDTTANGRYIQSNSINVVSGNSYTSTFYVKANGRSIFFIYFNAAAFPTSSRIAWFDIANQTTQVQTGVTASITSVGNGWYRCSCTATANASTTTPCQLSIPSQTLGSLSNYTGNGFSGLFLWGAQLEAGSFATSYIPTTTASVTRNADAASMTGTNFSSWFNNGEGTLYADFTVKQLGIIADITVSSVNTNCAQLIARPSGGSAFEVFSNGALQATIGSGVLSGKIAGGYKVNDFAVSLNGAAAATDTSGTVPNGPTQLKIGSRYDDLYYPNGTYKKFAYYPIKATSTQLQALTV